MSFFFSYAVYKSRESRVRGCTRASVRGGKTSELQFEFFSVNLEFLFSLRFFSVDLEFLFSLRFLFCGS